MSDLIDREAAIGKIDPWLYSKGRCESEINMLRAVIAELKSLPAATRWVRCEDDKPKKNGRYIVFDNENGVYSAEFRKGRLGSEWTEAEEGWCNFRVTHWMPLLKPPRESKL